VRRGSTQQGCAAAYIGWAAQNIDKAMQNISEPTASAGMQRAMSID
jgi:hypothetical protein